MGITSLRILYASRVGILSTHFALNALIELLVVFVTLASIQLTERAFHANKKIHFALNVTTKAVTNVLMDSLSLMENVQTAR